MTNPKKDIPVRISNSSLLILLFIIVFTGCSDDGKHTESIKFSTEISIDETTIRDSFNISNLIDSIEVIPLTEEKHYFLGDIYKIFYSDKKFIVFDRFNSSQILLFNEDGTFIKRILGLGRAPDEALQIDDCWLNSDGSFDAYDAALKKVYQFDKDFQLKMILKGDKNLYHNLIRISGSDDFLAYAALNSYNKNSDSKNYQLNILNNKLDMVVGFLPYSDEIKGSNILSFNDQFHPYKNLIRFIRPFDNVIYNFSGKTLKDKMLLTYEKNPIDRNMFDELIQKNLSIFKDISASGMKEKGKLLKKYSYFYGDWAENTDWIVFSSKSKGSSFTSLYDKKDKQVTINAKKIYENRKYNMFLPTLTSTGDGYFIGVINSLYLKHYLIGKSVLEKYTNIDYNSFLIVKVKLKKKI